MKTQSAGYFYAHKNTSLIPALSQSEAIHTHPPYFNIVSSASSSSRCLFPSGFSMRNFVYFFCFQFVLRSRPTHAPLCGQPTCTAQSIACHEAPCYAVLPMLLLLCHFKHWCGVTIWRRRKERQMATSKCNGGIQNSSCACLRSPQEDWFTPVCILGLEFHFRFVTYPSNLSYDLLNTFIDFDSTLFMGGIVFTTTITSPAHLFHLHVRILHHFFSSINSVIPTSYYDCSVIFQKTYALEIRREMIPSTFSF